MESVDNVCAKQRILDVAAEMFSGKGYAATRVERIAQEAGVNKALIYYYFPSKEAILDHLIESFFQTISDTGISFIEDTIVKFKQEGRMDFHADRINFATKDDLSAFLSATMQYYEKMLDSLLAQRQILRIIMLESLSDGKHKGVLFRYYSMMSEKEQGNPLYMTVYNADPNFDYDESVIFRKFFFSLMPLICFAVYSHDYSEMSGQSVDSLKSICGKAILSMWDNYLEDASIVFQTNKTAL